MTVYVDDMRAPYRRMIMCHMIADTADELHAMASKIGVARRWYQGDHYDICQSKREKAVNLGAKEVTQRQLAAMAYLQRIGHEPGDPITAPTRMLKAKRVRRGET